MDPRFKTEPYKHQLDAFNRFKDSQYFALFFEQRVGKSKTVIDIAAEKYRTGEIDSLLVIAPNGVHRQWTADALPEHMPDDTNYRAELWNAQKVKQVGVKERLRALLSHVGLRVLSVNIDAIQTEEFKGYANAFFRGHRVMTVVDESSDIASEKATRTKMAWRIGRKSRVRALLDGTPVAAGPLGLYGQCEFLGPATLGFTSYFAFKAHFAELKRCDFGERDKPCPECKKTGVVNGVRCPRCFGNKFIGRNQASVVQGYQNLPELKRRLAPFAMRVLRSQCHDLPPKIYEKIYFDLAPETTRFYQQLRDKFVAELKSGIRITAPMVLTRYLRLQQVSSGFVPVGVSVSPCPLCDGSDLLCEACEGLGVVETGEEHYEPTGPNSRLEAFRGAIAKLEGQGVVWCKFNYDVDSVVAMGQETGRRVVQYDGRIGASEKAQAVTAFQGGKADWFVAKPRSAGRGHDLAVANWTVYYSHDWSLRMRLQSEDRAQSLKKTDSVLYLDLVATDTVDDKIVNALRERKRISDMITGDNPEKWL